MESRFFKSRFSTHFNRLTYLGMWSEEILSDSTERKIYYVYRFFCFLFLTAAILTQMIDLYLVFGNLRKVTYNCCTSIVVVGIIVKLILLYDRKDYLNDLRLKLWKDSLKFDSPEEQAIQDLAYSQLKNMRNCFYLAAFVLIPIWIISSYFSYKWGPRHLAFAAYIPLTDPLNDIQYVPALMYQCLSGFYVIFLVIETDLAMFSIVLQMGAHYRILINNISKLNEIYGDDDGGSRFLKVKSSRFEVNVHLKKVNAQRLLKLLISRQLEILNYTRIFEYIYSRCMILQMFAASFLVVMNGLEISMYLQDLSLKLYFQGGYVVLIVVDIFYICYHLSGLSTESFNVGTAAYSTVWYNMDADLRRTLCMIIIRSQKPPRITAGKLFDMDLTTYLHMLRNIYSWLMLFRQIGNK